VAKVCALHRYHAPRPNRFVEHHIIPKVWGGRTTRSNLIIVCDTGHYSTHLLIDAYVKAQGDPGWKVRRSYAPSERVLAKRAWEGRPQAKEILPLTIPAMA
jgi:HNH endonuclease